ncbi:MAG TPA: nuclear transport factor 2 family protein [Solirubrobacterales bacterium]|nr:nuclear transport factor 2 family protein [Solirubrobacterales bacterium]
MAENQVIALEEQGWEALSASGEAARAFYERVLDGVVVMLLPGGLVLDDRAVVVQSMSGRPWSSYELEELRSFQPTEDTAVVTYGVVAERDEQRYSALVSSVYARRGDEWKLSFHQQTPR